MSQFIPVATEEQREHMMMAFQAIFRIDEGFDEFLFNPSVESRSLIFPVDFVLKPTQLQALATAMKAVGDDGFYFSILEADLEDDFIDHLYIPPDAVENYTNLPRIYSVLSNALFSPNERWGILFTIESYALIGGSSAFVDTFFNHLGIDPMAYVSDFIASCIWYQKELGADRAWLTNLLTHLYGEHQVEHLLDEGHEVYREKYQTK